VGVLAGCTVVVTRATDQADGLAAELVARGAVPVVVPLIEIVALPDGQRQLAELAPRSFDWLVVTSPNGARAYAASHGSAAPAQVAAVGATTAAALATAGIAVTFVPSRQLAAGLLAEFPAPTPSASQVLLVQAAGAQPELAAGLVAKGWHVTVVAPYRSAPARPTARQQLQALAAHAVLFASGSAARAWVDVFGPTTPPLVVAIGPQTAAAATAAGLKIDVVAADHSVVGMIAALERLLDHSE
jgi:uroporphyrinogen-III synthase